MLLAKGAAAAVFGFLLLMLLRICLGVEEFPTDAASSAPFIPPPPCVVPRKELRLTVFFLRRRYRMTARIRMAKTPMAEAPMMMQVRSCSSELQNPFALRRKSTR